MSRLNRILSHAEEFLLGLLLATASLVLFINVVARYIFNWGFPWAEDSWFVTKLSGWSFWGEVPLHGKVSTSVVDIVVKFAPRPLRKLTEALINLISLVFCLLVLFYGAKLIMQTRMFGQVSPALQVPMWLVQLAIPVGGGLMALRFAQQLWHVFRGEKMEAHPESLG